MHGQFKSGECDSQCRSSVFDHDNLIADAQYRFLEALPQPVELGWMEDAWQTGPLSRELVRNFNRAFYTLFYRHESEWVACPIDDLTDTEAVQAILAMSLDELRRIAPNIRRAYRKGGGDRLMLIKSDSDTDGEERWQMRSRHNRRRRIWDR